MLSQLRTGRTSTTVSLGTKEIKGLLDTLMKEISTRSPYLFKILMERKMMDGSQLLLLML